MPARKTATLTVETKTKQEEKQLLSSGPLSPPLYFKEDKDTMAYEHDRQKSKKTLDRARNKARKAFGWGGNSPTSGKHPLSKTKSSDGAKKVEGGEEDRELAHDYFPTERRADTVAQQIRIYAGTPFTEVKLADLVLLAASDENNTKVVSRRKKGSAEKAGLDGDFEVVPHVRSVIVLDEQFVVPDVDVDDAWECIDDEEAQEFDAERKAKVTYARVAAAFKETK